MKEEVREESKARKEEDDAGEEDEEKGVELLGLAHAAAERQDEWNALKREDGLSRRIDPRRHPSDLSIFCTRRVSS